MIVDQTVAKQERVPSQNSVVSKKCSWFGYIDLRWVGSILTSRIKLIAIWSAWHYFFLVLRLILTEGPFSSLGFLENMWLTQHVHAGRCHHRALRVRRPTSPFVSCPFGSWQDLSIFRHSPKTLSISKGRRTDRDSRTRCPPLHRSCHLINYKIHVRQESSIDL